MDVHGAKLLKKRNKSKQITLMWLLFIGIPLLYSFADVCTHLAATSLVSLSIETKQMIILFTRVACSMIFMFGSNDNKEKEYQGGRSVLLYRFGALVLKGVCPSLAEAGIFYLLSQRLKIKMVHCCLVIYPVISYIWIQLYQNKISLGMNQMAGCLLIIVGLSML